MKRSFIGFGILLLLLPQMSFARGKNGIVSATGLLRGAHFRIQYIIPMHGNFSNYDKVEIVRLRSTLGSKVPQEKMDKFVKDLRKSFEKMGSFSQVAIVDSFNPSTENLAALRQAAQKQDKSSKGTLVVIGSIIDYAKGNRVLRELGVGLAPSVLTVRFSILDKENNWELARGNMAGVVQATWMSIPGISSNDMSFNQAGVAISDQVQRRTNAGLE